MIIIRGKFWKKYFRTIITKKSAKKCRPVPASPPNCLAPKCLQNGGPAGLSSFFINFSLLYSSYFLRHHQKNKVKILLWLHRVVGWEKDRGRTPRRTKTIFHNKKLGLKIPGKPVPEIFCSMCPKVLHRNIYGILKTEHWSSVLTKKYNWLRGKNIPMIWYVLTRP